MENNNVPIGSIQKILGHENRSTTEIYLHSLGNGEREAIDTLERVTNFSHTDSHTESGHQKNKTGYPVQVTGLSRKFGADERT